MEFFGQRFSVKKVSCFPVVDKCVCCKCASFSTTPQRACALFWIGEVHTWSLKQDYILGFAPHICCQGCRRSTEQSTNLQRGIVGTQNLSSYESRH